MFSIDKKTLEVLNMKRLTSTLSKIHTAGITNKNALISNMRLYEEVVLNIDHFISSTVFRSHANINKLNELKKLGVDIEDIHMDCIERIISKLDLVLSNNIEHQIPYMYTICNHIIVDRYRKAIRYYSNIVSLDEALTSHEANKDSKNSSSLYNYLMDPKASPETKYMTKEEIIEIFQKYSNNVDNLLCILAIKVFNDKPRELATQLIHKGSVDKVLTIYEHALSDYFGISISELPPVSPAKATGLSKLL